MLRGGQQGWCCPPLGPPLPSPPWLLAHPCDPSTMLPCRSYVLASACLPELFTASLPIMGTYRATLSRADCRLYSNKCQNACTRLQSIYLYTFIYTDITKMPCLRLYMFIQRHDCMFTYIFSCVRPLRLLNICRRDPVLGASARPCRVSIHLQWDTQLFWGHRPIT